MTSYYGDSESVTSVPPPYSMYDPNDTGAQQAFSHPQSYTNYGAYPRQPSGIPSVIGTRMNYTAAVDTRYQARNDADERAPLIDRTSGNPDAKPKDDSTVPWAWASVVLLLFAVTCIAAIIASNQTHRVGELNAHVEELNKRMKDYPPTPGELEELRRDYDIVRAAHEQDYKTWDATRTAYKADEERWLKARNDYFELRIDEGNLLGLSWRQVESHECVAFGTRAVTARLAVNKAEACRHMPIVVDGIAVDEPHVCHTDGETFAGRWNVGNVTACRPHWGGLNDKGCIGQGSGKHRFEARLWDIHNGDWMAMCSTSPQEINGQVFEHPTHCESRGLFGVFGMFGLWDVDDNHCR
ncbi:uncharacterized protein C8Q71DRAFT_730138 [Rhodofomes roseus]|uniref:Uncharacterized protein n=1 Tax=Rhodofomes roseus TaxID=34475 RepID=A0ABQ8KXM3_9APHY|nr:uncharacterized protein C8Q71DRAFT_730138 [Rhodofomes roseus]KAH9843819.1 hypothetical protein C8Q71DRAFT_730138 [Rhodofomes roseus]